MRLPRVPTVYVLGTALPATLLGLILLTAGATVLGVVAHRAGVPLIQAAALVPDLVLQGEAWRLLTWVFFEPEPLGLVFVCLLLGWFGRDLSYAWGALRFLGVYLGFAVAVGSLTCLVALAWRDLGREAYLSAWPLGEAVLIAWAIEFPNRKMLAYLVIPVGGRNLVYLTVAGTALFALFHGIGPYLPHFLAIGLMLVFARYPSLDLLLMRVRLALTRQPPSRRTGHLRVVRRPEEEEPPRWLH